MMAWHVARFIELFLMRKIRDVTGIYPAIALQF